MLVETKERKKLYKVTLRTTEGNYQTTVKCWQPEWAIEVAGFRADEDGYNVLDEEYNEPWVECMGFAKEEV